MPGAWSPDAQQPPNNSHSAWLARMLPLHLCPPACPRASFANACCAHVILTFHLMIALPCHANGQHFRLVFEYIPALVHSQRLVLSHPHIPSNGCITLPCQWPTPTPFFWKKCRRRWCKCSDCVQSFTLPFPHSHAEPPGSEAELADVSQLSTQRGG